MGVSPKKHMDTLTRVIQFILGTDTKQVPGYVPDTVDPRDVYSDEIVSGETTLPEHFLTNDNKYLRQGAFPFCVAFSICRAAEWLYKIKTGIDVTFSEAHLFFRGGGNRDGASVRPLLEYARTKGFVLNEELPMPGDLYDLSSFDWLRARAFAIEPTGDYKIGGYVRVNPNQNDMARDMMKFHELIVIVAANGGYWLNDKILKAGYYYNHAARWLGFKTSDYWEGMDSLQRDRAFDGRHTFDWSYTPGSVFAITDLPADWREQRDAARLKVAPNNANYYGKSRDFSAEVAMAAKMDKAFKSFNNQSVYEAAGKFWNMYVRACVYGEYSVTDVVNSCYNWRRTGKQAFDFDSIRKH